MKAIRSPLNAPSTHRLKIRGCRVQAWIGIYPHEQAQRSTLIFDLDIDVDARRAARSDRIEDTVDYARVIEDLRRDLSERRFFLVEAMSEFVADRIIRKYGAERVHLTIIKQSIVDQVDGVGVEVERFSAVDTAVASGRIHPHVPVRTIL